GLFRRSRFELSDVRTDCTFFDTVGGVHDRFGSISCCPIELPEELSLGSLAYSHYLQSDVCGVSGRIYNRENQYPDHSSILPGSVVGIFRSMALRHRALGCPAFAL